MSYIYNLTDTWNAAGTTFAGIKMAVTNTASGASSNLLDLSVSGATTANFTVNKSGALSLNGSVTSGTQQTAQGSLILANTAAGAFATTVQSSNSASAAWTLTLPTTAGTANYALTTNGSGVSSWSQISLTAGVTGTLPLANGGTNANLTASNGGIVYSDASAFAVLAGTATAGQILRSGASGAPSWSTATYPTTTTANQLLYSSAANTVGGLASANTSALVTNSSGVPSFTSGGTANRVLRTDGTTVSFAQVGLTTDVTGVLPVANGGTNASSASITAFNNITGYTATGATGTTSTNLVFSTSPNITTPTFTTSATGPLFIGGTGTTSTLTLRSTSGVGTTGADIIFQTGNNGATEAMRILNSGNIGIGASPSYKLDVSGTFRTTGATYLNTGATATGFAVGGSTAYDFADIFGSMTVRGTLSIYSALIQFINGSSGAYTPFNFQNGQAEGVFSLNGYSVEFRNSSANAAALMDFYIGSSVVARINNAGAPTFCYSTATPAGGSTSARLLLGTTSGFGIYYGSGAPTVSAAQGSIYLRSDGTQNNRLYINTDGSTTWTAFNTTA